MPAHAGIHDLLCCDEDKSWIPAFAGMTGVGNVRQYFGPLVLHAIVDGLMSSYEAPGNDVPEAAPRAG